MAIKIALAGNPNCGKTTLFNALTGSNQFVGNWPGVTVEKKEGKLKGHKDVVIMDLPGIYSLSPYTLEEVVARNYLITERPDAILNIVDGTNLERNLYLSTQLMELGIEADMILMHPYDKWGLNEMDKDACDWYLRYVVARYGAYRNVWWSLANEFDFIRIKTLEDWERYGQVVSSNDPFHRLLSVHNGGPNYDFSRDWVTHCSLQRVDFYRTTEDTDQFVEKYGKPVVWDEICYEGNIGLGWGNITGEELVRRFWEAFVRGGHCGHGETFMDPEDILWWSHGGILKGESPARLRFLLDVLQDVPGGYLTKGEGIFDEVVGYAGGHVGEGWGICYDYAIHYLGVCQPTYRQLVLPEDTDYEVDVIDTWNMTITPMGVKRGICKIELPGNQYMALRVRKAG